jgi:DNA-binding NarL/FixJ family response regulator
MSLKLAEQLALTQEFLKVDKTEFDKAIEEANQVYGAAKQYYKTLMKIKKIVNVLKSLEKKAKTDEINETLERYPKIKTLIQAEIVVKMLSGMSVKEIADSMNVAEKTIKFHKTKIFSSLGFKSTMEMIKHDRKLMKDQFLSKGIQNGN